MSDMNITPEQIKEGRERMRMTQSQLAEEVGVSLRTVSSWERGESSPLNRSTVVAEILGINVKDEGPQFGTAALLRRVGYLAKRRREELGLSRLALSKAAHIGAEKTITNFEFGRNLPSGTSLRKLEKALEWRLGAVDDVMRMVDRKAESISMEEIDAEDSLHIASQGAVGLAYVSNEDLIAELRRRLNKVSDLYESDNTPQNLYGLAASTNSEHLEDEEK